MQNIVLIVCNFIVPKLIITHYGSNVNGLISSITQFLAYITLLESGIGPVIKAKLYKPIADKNESEIRNILFASEKFFKNIAKIFIVYILILLVVYPLIVGQSFDILFTISLLVIISLSTMAEYYFGMTYKLYLQSIQKTYITAYFQIVSLIVNTIAIVLLVRFNTSILLVKLISGLILVLRPIILCIYVKKKYNINLDDVDKNYKLENKWDGLAQHIAAVVHDNTDIAVLTIFTNMLEVSVYSVYLLIVKGIKSIVNALTGGIDAVFGNMLANNEHEHLRKSFSTYEALYFTLITVIYTCTLVLILPFVSVYTKGITDVNYIRDGFAFLIVLAELVFNFGLIGVAIGTLCAMTIRTIEFNYHTSIHILKRNYFKGLIKPIIALIEALIIYIIIKQMNFITITSYVDWIIYGVLTLSVSLIIILIVNVILYKEDFNNFINILKRVKNKSHS